MQKRISLIIDKDLLKKIDVSVWLLGTNRSRFVRYMSHQFLEYINELINECDYGTDELTKDMENVDKTLMSKKKAKEEETR